MKQLQRPDATIRYIREGTGTPLVLVQGAGVIGEGWRPQIDALRASHAIVALDNRGIGGSTYRASALTIEDMAADVLAIADAEGFDRFHLAGHSIGGLIAQEIALRARPRVLGLALLCTFERGGQASRLTPAIIWKGLRTRIGTRAMRRQAFMELVMPGGYLAGVDREALASQLATLFGHDLADQPAIVMKQLGAASRFDASGRLQDLAGVPTLVLSAPARRDRATGVRPRARRAHSRRALRRDRGRGACRDDSVRARGQCVAGRASRPRSAAFGVISSTDSRPQRAFTGGPGGSGEILVSCCYRADSHHQAGKQKNSS